MSAVESDVVLYGDRVALWFADEMGPWRDFVLDHYCVPCKGRGYFIARVGWNETEYPTCWHCGGEGRPRHRATEPQEGTE